MSAQHVDQLIVDLWDETTFGSTKRSAYVKRWLDHETQDRPMPLPQTYGLTEAEAKRLRERAQEQWDR